VPWQWPAVGSMRVKRRVLDMGDDWATLIPSRARRMRELYLRAAAEADEIVVVSEVLAELFGGRQVRVVRNGVDEALLASSPPAPPRARRIVYVGMLSERFDAPLVGRVLDRLPGWTAEIYGPCAYRGNGSKPGPELAALLAREDGRARWHGPVAREQLPDVLDRADVLLVPNRPHCAGQVSMKIYDYAARGRPIVATTMAADGISELPPHSRLGNDADELAGLICEAQHEPATAALERIEWAAAQSWDSRWREWSTALFGEIQDDPSDPRS
jgi:glycosyltransferase involved in cell wall biosynthesis